MSIFKWVSSALVAVALAGSFGTAEAAGPSIGQLGLGGTGCPAGTATASLSGGGTVLSLKFTQYRAATTGSKTFDRKFCGVAIPFTAPPGKSVALVGVQLKGRASLPAGSTGVISAETFFAGGTGPVVTKNLSGPQSGPVSFSTLSGAKIWSACGSSFILRVNTSALVRGKGASLSIRSQDVAAGIVYQLAYKSC